MSEKNALIKAGQTAVRLSEMVAAPISSLLDDSVRDNSYLLGFPVDTPEGKAMLFAMESDGTEKVEDYRDKPFPLIAWGCKRVPLYDDQSREYVPVIRTVLIGTGGITLAVVSDGIAASLDLIRALYGDGPFQPALSVIIKEARTRRGHRLYKLIPEGVIPTTSTRRSR